MNGPDFLLLFVASPAASARFYEALLGRPPVEASETFVMFVCESGPKIGLWSRATVAPATTAAPGAAEYAWSVASPGAVDDVHATWVSRGVTILHQPVNAEFGRTFLATDPDGHRLRVFCPN